MGPVLFHENAVHARWHLSEHEYITVVNSRRKMALLKKVKPVVHINFVTADLGKETIQNYLRQFAHLTLPVGLSTTYLHDKRT